VLGTRGWRHGQFSFKNLIAFAVVGKEDIILVGEYDLPFRNAHGSRHAGLDYLDIFTTEVF
jgi:hypothetical protein